MGNQKIHPLDRFMGGLRLRFSLPGALAMGETLTPQPHN